MRVLVSGASGLIGKALCASLRGDGDEAVRLVRRPAVASDEIQWDPANGQLDPFTIGGFDAVVHLSGAGIGDRRWSESRRKEIRDSRLDSTALLAESLAATQSKPAVLISGSAIGFYGERLQPVTENDGPAEPPDFLSELVVAWEAATAAAEAAGIRTVHIRTGIVLSKEGGALKKLLLPFRFGVGGKLGDGRTWWSWISIDDQVRAIKHLINSSVEGPVNLTAPNPVTNGQLTKVLGQVLRRPALLPVPRFVLEVLLGRDLARALLFTSAQVLPAKLEESGFQFEHPDVKTALQAVLGRG